MSANPKERASEIVRVAGLKAGAMSAGLALPPGPMGMLTVIPDLLKVWQIQQQVVADVAACFGRSAHLNCQMMVYCLFRHGAAMLLRDVVARVGERVIVKQASLRVVQQTLRRIGVQVTYLDRMKPDHTFLGTTNLDLGGLTECFQTEFQLVRQEHLIAKNVFSW